MCVQVSVIRTIDIQHVNVIVNHSKVYDAIIFQRKLLYLSFLLGVLRPQQIKENQKGLGVFSSLLLIPTNTHVRTTNANQRRTFLALVAFNQYFILLTSNPKLHLIPAQWQRFGHFSQISMMTHWFVCGNVSVSMCVCVCVCSCCFFNLKTLYNRQRYVEI